MIFQKIHDESQLISQCYNFQYYKYNNNNYNYNFFLYHKISYGNCCNIVIVTFFFFRGSIKVAPKYTQFQTNASNFTPRNYRRRCDVAAFEFSLNSYPRLLMSLLIQLNYYNYCNKVTDKVFSEAKPERQNQARSPHCVQSKFY